MTSTKIRGTPSARSAASRRTHGVVSVTRTTSEMEVATRLTTSRALPIPGAAGEGLLDERPLLALADASARAHRELALQEPLRGVARPAACLPVRARRRRHQ